jgi:hypothetical protein
MSTAEIVEGVLDPFTECLTPEAARKILAIQPDAATQHRVSELAAKAELGQLSEDERAAYHDLIETFDLVAILKARARAVLADRGSNASPRSRVLHLCSPL